MERRKRRRHTGKTKPTTNADHEAEQTAGGGGGGGEGEGARAGQSEFIKALPASSLIKYLDKHRLLHSPLRTPSTAVDHEGAAAGGKKQLMEDYQRFALLVSCAPSGQQPAADGPETSHQLPSPGPAYTATKAPPPSSDISPDTSALSSHRSSAASSPSMARSSSSSSSFYHKLFSPTTAELLHPQEQEGEEEQEEGEGEGEEAQDPAAARKKKKPYVHRPDSLFQFDKTLTTIVQSHHHRTFPSLLQPHHGVDSTPHNATYSPDSLSHTLLPLHPPPFPPSKSCATLTHHGFPFNILLPHSPPLIPPLPNSPSDHVRLIEDHVLSHFVYSVKTRGNALRPK